MDTFEKVLKYLEYDQYASQAIKPLQKLWDDMEAEIQRLTELSPRPGNVPVPDSDENEIDGGLIPKEAQDAKLPYLPPEESDLKAE